ncbi:MAG: hypothetical protein [Caudoviricetes sp.]|nr:MAG: hypothetical protein [Caudoviricetes sp.]
MIRCSFVLTLQTLNSLALSRELLFSKGFVVARTVHTISSITNAAGSLGSHTKSSNVSSTAVTGSSTGSSSNCSAIAILSAGRLSLAGATDGLPSLRVISGCSFAHLRLFASPSSFSALVGLMTLRSYISSDFKRIAFIAASACSSSIQARAPCRPSTSL